MHWLLTSAAIPGKKTSLHCSYMWNLPRGVLKFSLNASIDILPTFTNLKRWGKDASVNCHLCGNTVKQMLFHVLVNCNHTIDQRRTTWKDDSVLKHIAGCLKSALESLSTVEVYCNLERLQAPGGGSIPALVMAQTQRPDLVILDSSDHGWHRLSLVQLTCPCNTDDDKVRDCKISRYAGLKEVLSNEGLELWSVYDRGWSTGTYFQVGKGPSLVFIPVLGPSKA
jgi:hypothetical protein